jgi:hypothetical protein
VASLGVPRIRHRQWTVRMPTARLDHLASDKNMVMVKVKVKVKIKVKVKQSLYRPREALRVSGGSKISKNSVRLGGSLFSPKHRSLLLSENIRGTHICYRLSRL